MIDDLEECWSLVRPHFVAFTEGEPVKSGFDPTIQPGGTVQVSGAANPEHNGEFIITSVSHTMMTGASPHTDITIQPGMFVGRDGRRYELVEPVTIPPGGKGWAKMKRLPDPMTSWERIMGAELF